MLVAEIAGSFTYASFQNAVPVVRSVGISNVNGGHHENCRVELTSSPAFLRPKSWTLDRLAPGDELTLGDRKVDLDADYLVGLNEAERGVITLRLSAGDETLDERRFDVRLLARDEWGGVADMALLLPAFVMPNDPAVARVLRTAAERLVDHGHPGGLDGYQSGDPSRAYMIAAAIYSAVAAMDIYYAEPPASFEDRGQKVRRPATIADERLGTCLDTTLLFAAALEGAGLYPVILMFHGHAAVGLWLTKRTFSNTIETDQMEVRKALASRELVVFETTGVTHRPPMALEAAQRTLDHRMAEEEAHAFVAAIDVRRARSGGITPLASHEARQRDRSSENESDDAPVTELSLPAAPAFNDLPVDLVEVKPTTAAGRIDRWQKKLLDLTLRNRLLNFPSTKKTIPFLCTDVAYLEDRLAEGAAMQIVSLPQQNPLGERDAELYRDVHGRDLQRGFATEALKRDELPSPLDQQQLDARLIDLHRQVRNDFAEGGANTLFLAVGFLRWKKKPEDERSYRAPLLLVPVKLERRSASSPFRLRFHEDEPRFNATLLQFLEREFDLRLSQFAGELPTDGSGIDVPRLLTMMRQAVRDVPGMEVVDETALSTFSFAKFLMWKDLVERTDALRENRVVRHLIDTPEKAFGDGQAAFRDEAELDRAYEPADIICLLPSDSSQTSASLAAAEGRDFVIVGPPGTGKSQTIANMIANCLAVGKTVLFVAEKTAALDVVYRRLREHGLGDHCVELHSNKADRRHFLSQLKAAWEHGNHADPAEWIAVNERLKLRRDTLNSYVEALHRTYPNGWTPYLALGTALQAIDRPAPAFDWPRGQSHDVGSLTHLEELAHELGQVFASIERRPALNLVDVENMDSARQEAVLAAAQSLRSAAELLDAALGAYRGALGVTSADIPDQAEIAALVRLAEAVEDVRGRDVAAAFDTDLEECAEALAALEAAIGAYRDMEHGLSAPFAAASVRAIDLEVLDAQWREANASLWPMSALGRRRITRLLQSYADVGGAQVEDDLPRLRRMKDLLAAIDSTPLAEHALPIAGLDTDAGAVRDILERARHLRLAVKLDGRNQEVTEALTGRVSAELRAGCDAGWMWQSGSKLLSAVKGFDEAQTRFNREAGRCAALDDEPGALSKLAADLAALADARHLLRDWTSWCRVRNRALAHGLESLVRQLEVGAVEPIETRTAFRLGYARWWLPAALDGDPVLRDFRRFQHENAVSEFREIDDLVRTHATARVVGAIAHGLPPVQSVPRNSELGLLRHQMELQRPSQSIRDMIGRMPESFSKLAPCMLMSPLSIAQYFPPNQSLFDVVIFDEASQITTWDAVGAIARGRQTIIVGDPKQLPPTNFFGRNEEEEEVEDYERDLESILDEAKASGIPVRDLRWHYRSRSESLIAFSNHHYYQNRLVTFPSPQVEDRAVLLRKVPHGIYDRGKSRTNRIEAQAVADEAVARMRGWLALPEKSRPTLGVITFNAQQQSLIMDLLDAARREEPELEWFFADDRVEATIVKNLENVQGDERDVILFSITFWKDAAGKATMDFGALNRDGGERRLNVAVTRARQELIVFSGFTADQIDPTRTKATAVHHLKTFLDYAERGAIALPAQTEGSVGGFESPFEQAVAEQLERRGWQVEPQVGISGFRIDLGVRHPDLAGAYLAGIECDGASYHSAATARDRDKVREQVLTGLGWDILRVWSTDWWYDAAGCVQRLHDSLKTLLQKSRASDEESREAVHWDMGHEVEEVEEIRDADVAILPEAIVRDASATDAERVASIGSTVSVPDPVDETQSIPDGLYRLTDLADFPIAPARFHEFTYRDTLRSMVEAVIQTESPLRTDILCQRIARAHGWLRTGGKIRDRINMHLRDFERTEESSGEFIWKVGQVTRHHPYRSPATEDARRAIPDIPLAELAAVVLENPALLEEPDPARELARLLGVERLATGSRLRLDEAIARAVGSDSEPSTESSAESDRP
jgi:very-short-patch-repair endonuclease/RecA/RadA recombinase